MSQLELIVLVAFALYGLGAEVAERLRLRGIRGRAARRREAVREAGLELVEELDLDTVAAKAGTLRVRLGDIPIPATRGTRLQIDGPRLAPGLTLRREPLSLPPADQRPREVELGDEEFDREVSVQGFTTLALAVLDAPTRHAVRTLLRGPFQPRGWRPLWVTGQLEDGRLVVDVPPRVPRLRRGSSRDEPEQAGSVHLDGEYRLPEVLRAALDLAGRLEVPKDLPGRLAANLAKEPAAGVRRRLLGTLLRDYPDHAATREAVRSAREDEDAELRLRAGIALGAAGRDVLLGVAGGEGAEDATSARAMAALGPSLSREEASELLRSALRTRRLETAAACLAVLGTHGEAAVPLLARVLLVEKGEAGAAAARALAATGSPAAEAPLLRALGESAPEVRSAAAVALGRVGTRDAVLPLRDAETNEAALRGVARQAIAEIHTRLAGAAKGQLSLAGGEAGRLSIAEDASGQLSLIDGRPQVSC